MRRELRGRSKIETIDLAPFPLGRAAASLRPKARRQEIRLPPPLKFLMGRSILHELGNELRSYAGFWRIKDHHSSRHLVHPRRDNVTRLRLARRLDGLAPDFNQAAFDRISGVCAGLINADGPEPLV